MSDITRGLRYIVERWDIVGPLLRQHLTLTAGALLIALLIAMPLGIFAVRFPRAAAPLLGLLGIIYTIPSLALLIVLIPFLGLGTKTALTTLVVYAQIILVRNIIAGLKGIEPALLEAARGMGMNAWQRWWRVELPLAAPIILAGVRIATVVIIGIATIAAKINAGGLGDLLFRGIEPNRQHVLWAGVITIAALTFALNGALLALERRLDPQRRAKR